jgi:hypothetical protein
VRSDDIAVSFQGSSPLYLIRGSVGESRWVKRFHGLLEPETFPEPAQPVAGCPVNTLLQS